MAGREALFWVTNAQRERLKAQKRAYYARHRDRIRQENVERAARYRKANLEMVRKRDREAAKRRRERDPEADVLRGIRRRYGLTREQWEAMLVAQGGLCAICGGPPPLDVDHSHETGKVRGLLCRSCNRGLGMLKDNAEICAKAAAYVVHHSEHK